MDFRPAKSVNGSSAIELWDGNQQIATIYAQALGVVVTTEGPWQPGPLAIDVRPADAVHLIIKRKEILPEACSSPPQTRTSGSNTGRAW